MNRKLASLVAVAAITACLLSLPVRVSARSGISTAATTVLKAADLQSDFAILRKAYETMHPGLYRYNTKTEMDSEFEKLKLGLNRDQTLREAYVAISLFLARIKCGHSYANFYNQPKSVVAELFKGQNRVPFYFRWLDERMIVTRNLSSDVRLKPGTEITKINGIKVRDILLQLMQIARADGSNDAKRVAYLEVSGEDEYEAFDIFLPLFYPFSSTDLKLTARFNGSRTPIDITVPALSFDQRAAMRVRPASSPKESDAAFQFSYLNDETAILRMPTWAFYNSKWDWKGFLNEAFKTLDERKTPNLIIDIRANEGGQDVGDVIIGKLSSSDVKVSAVQRMVRYRKAPDDLLNYLDTWDKSFKDWGDRAVDAGNGFYRLSGLGYDNAEFKTIKASGSRYLGRTFVLAGPTNSSATFQFAQVVKDNKLATLVGQPTGGNQRGINGGAFFFLRLPNSKIEVDLPLIASFPPNAPDAGIDPDVYVLTTASDIAVGRDPEVEAVLGLIKKSGKRRSR